MRFMLINDLLHMYVSWLFAATMFIWLGSVLHRTTRNTFFPDRTQAIEVAGVPIDSISEIPVRRARKPRIPLTASGPRS